MRPESLRLHLPQLAELESADFPVIQSEVKNYKVVLLPPLLRALFDEKGFSVVRINSPELREALPDFGGKSSADYSLLPHQDHHSNDPRRFLILSKLTKEKRGASTLIMFPSVAAKLLPYSEKYFSDNRRDLKAEASYDARFAISEEQYWRCFDEASGYEDVVRENIGEKTDAETQLFGRTRILGYLIRGSHADELVPKLMKQAEGEFIAEKWEKPGVVIIDNARVFHARIGGNTPPLKRNYAV